MTNDDVVVVQNSIGYYEALQKHHIPSELHIYEFGRPRLRDTQERSKLVTRFGELAALT